MRLPKELKEFDFMKKEKRQRRISNANNLPSNGFERLEKLFFGLISACLKTVEAIVSIYLGIILIPTLAILWFINEIVRVLIISPLLNYKFGKGKYELVTSAQDNIWSFRKPLNSRNMLILSVYKNNPTSYESSSSSLSSCSNIDVHTYAQKFLKNVINYVDKNKRKPYEKLKWILAQKLGYCVWEKTVDPNQTNKKNDNKSRNDNFTHHERLITSDSNQVTPKKIFDIKNHVRILNMEKSLDKDFVAESDLHQILFELAQDMDDEKPQWENVIIPNFVYDCDVPQYERAKRIKIGEGDEGSNNIYQFIKTLKIFRFHHGYMDVNSALSIITKINDIENEGRVSVLHLDPLAPLQLNRWKSLRQFVYLLTFGTWKLIRAICAEMYADSRFITPRFKGRIHHAWSDFIKMEDLEKIRKQTGVQTDSTMTEIFICALSAALRAVSMKFCKKAPWLIFPDTLESSCFIGLVRSLLPYPQEGPINNFGVVGFDVDTTPVGGKEEEDNDWAMTTRLQRFELARKLYQERIQGSPLVVLNHYFQTFVGRFPTFVMQYLFRDSGCPVIFNNVPWIQAKLKLKEQEKAMGGGNELEDWASFMPMLTSTGLGITTAKYKDKMRFCAVTEAACLSSQELKYFLNAMRDEIMSMLNECEDADNTSGGNNRDTLTHTHNRPKSSYNNRTKVHCS